MWKTFGMSVSVPDTLSQIFKVITDPYADIDDNNQYNVCYSIISLARDDTIRIDILSKHDTYR